MASRASWYHAVESLWQNPDFEIQADGLAGTGPGGSSVLNTSFSRHIESTLKRDWSVVGSHLSISTFFVDWGHGGRLPVRG